MTMKTVQIVAPTGIYQILCKPTGRVYIGSAVYFSKRKSQHWAELRNGDHFNQYLQRAWNKYGSDAFEFSVLECCEKEKLIEREQYYIDTLKATDREYGFNRRVKADSNRGVKQSDETRKKISAIRKLMGCTLPPEAIEMSRIRMKGNNLRLGIKHTPEAMDKMKEARKGRTPALGHHPSEELKQKISLLHKGVPLSQTHREKIAAAHRGKKMTAEHNWNAHVAQSKIKPDQFEKIKAEYIPGVIKMRDIAARYGCCTQTICNVINGNRMVCQ